MNTLEENKKAPEELKKTSDELKKTPSERKKTPPISIKTSPPDSQTNHGVRFESKDELSEKSEEKERRNHFFPTKLSPRKSKTHVLTSNPPLNSNKKNGSDRSLTKRLSRKWSSDSRESQPKTGGLITNNNSIIVQNEDKQSQDWVSNLDQFLKEGLNSCSYGKNVSYSEPKCSDQIRKIPLLKDKDTLTISQYIEMKKSQINKIQIEKWNVIKELVALFTSQNNLEELSLDLKLKQVLEAQLKTIIKLSMCTTWSEFMSQTPKTNQNHAYNQTKLSDSIEDFWIELVCYLQVGELHNTFIDNVDKLDVLFISLFPLTTALELFQTTCLPSLGNHYHTPYFISLNYLNTLCQSVLKQEICALFIKEYTDNVNPSENEFICIRDLFLYLKGQKEKFDSKNILTLALVETVLQHSFVIPYQNFIQELQDKEETENTFKIRTSC